MRVSSFYDSGILLGIQQSSAAYQTALQQVSSGQRVTVPSDDPTASALLVQTLSDSDAAAQYTKNASAALGQAQTADSALSSVVSLLTQAVTLGTQGTNGTNTAANRQTLATQVQGILASVVSAANTTYQGQAVFAGTQSGAAAFVPNGSGGYTYQGDGSTKSIQIGASLSVQVGLAGNQVFTKSGSDVLAALGQLAGALTSGPTSAIGTATASVTTALNYVTAQHAVYGNSINQITAQETYLSQEKVTLSTQATNLVGIDTATAAINLSKAEAQSSAVLAAAAKTFPETLLDYLK